MSSLSSPKGFTSPHLAQVVKEFPSLPIIIERLGGIGRDEAPPHPKFRQILALAQYPNIYIYTKIHGLGEICQRPIPFPEPMRFLSIPPFMEMAYDAFGASRVMWESDFPPVAGREGYCNALHWTMDHIPSRTAAAKEWMFGKTALSLFNFAG